MNGERVDAAFEFARQRRVDHAMAFEPALSAERFRHNIKPEMSLTAGSVPGMTFMQMRFVFDMHALRREGREQFGRDDVLHAHKAAALAMREH